MLWLICYDITDNRRRMQVMNELRNFGVGVQRSVFECRVSPAQFIRLKTQIQQHIQLEDRITYYPLCRKDAKRVMVDGVGKTSVDPDYYLV